MPAAIWPRLGLHTKPLFDRVDVCDPVDFPKRTTEVEDNSCHKVKHNGQGLESIRKPRTYLANTTRISNPIRSTTPKMPRTMHISCIRPDPLKIPLLLGLSRSGNRSGRVVPGWVAFARTRLRARCGYMQPVFSMSRPSVRWQQTLLGPSHQRKRATEPQCASLGDSCDRDMVTCVW